MSQRAASEASDYESDTSSSSSTLSEEFTKNVLEDVDNAGLATEELVQKAKSYIMSLPPNIEVIKGIAAAPVLLAMIDHAPCDRGRRYAACVIICCGVKKLVNVANDWVKFLLLPFARAAYKNPTPPYSDYSTPTLDDTELSITPVKQNRPSSFRELINKRQAGKCAVIKGIPAEIKSEAAHIIKQSLAKEDGLKAGITRSPSLAPTWNIIRHYTNIPVDSLENSLDSPENGILFQVEMHRAFEHFEWCLVATGQQDTYDVKWFVDPLLIFSFGREVVTFQNQSNQPNIPLPKPEYLALHASIAHILHETKLGEYLSTILDYFMPNSLSVLPGKFNSAEDLQLRITLIQIFEPTLLET